MAQRGFLREEIDYFRSCVNGQQIRFDRLEWELSQLKSKFPQLTGNLVNTWQSTRAEIDLHKEDLYYQQGYLRDLDN